MIVRVLCAAVLFGSIFATRVLAQTWDGGSITTINWSDAANWNPNAIPANDGTANLIMAGNVDVTNTVDFNFNINSLSFANNPAAPVFTIQASGGSTLIVGAGGIINNDPDLQHINVPLILGAGQTWNAASGDLQYESPVSLNGQQLTLSGAATHWLMSGMTGAGSIVKNGTGGVRFVMDSNSFSGSVTLNAGTIAIGDTYALGTGPLIINGGALGSHGVVSHLFSNPLTVNGDFSTSQALGGAGGLTLAGLITLTGDRTITTSINNGTDIVNAIGEDAPGRSFAKSGNSSLRIAGETPNTYTGNTNVNAGILRLDKTPGVNAIAGGTLFVGDGIGSANADVVELLDSNQIADTTIVSVALSGRFNANGFSETVQQLHMNGGNVQTGGGTLTVTNQILQDDAADAMSTITGNLSLGGGIVSFNIEDGTPATDLNISAAIANGGLTKFNDGRLEFSGASPNTYTGLTTVSDGTLLLNKLNNVVALAGDINLAGGSLVLNTQNQLAAAADISATGGAINVLASNAVTSMQLQNSNVNIGGMATVLTMNGTWGATGIGGNQTSTVLGSAGTTLDLVGAGANVTVSADPTFTSVLVLNAVVTGTSGLTKLGNAELRLDGAVANTFTGTINVSAGTLSLAKDAAVNAISGNVIVGDGVGGVEADVLRLIENHQIAQLATDTLTVNSSGLFDLAGRTETIGNLQLNAGRVAGGTLSLIGTVTSSAQSSSAQLNAIIDLLSATMAFNVNDGAASDDLILGGAIQNGEISKAGLGTLKISGTNPNTATLPQVSFGTVVLDKNGVNALGGTQIIVGDGTGPAESDVLRYGANDNQLPDTFTVIVQTAGLFDLNGRSDTIGTLTVNGTGAVQTGVGSVAISTQVITSETTAGGTIKGNLSLAGGLRPFDIANNPGAAVELNVSAALSNGTLKKQGTGTLALTGSALTSQASFQLDDGIISADGLSVAATRSFTQNAGAFSGTLNNSGAFIYNGGTFGGQLVNKTTGTTTFNANFTAAGGLMNEGTLTISTGRIVTASGPGFNNQGVVLLTGGTLAAGATLNFSNDDSITGHGELAAPNVSFTNFGQITVAGGDLVINSSLSPLNQGTITVPTGFELKLPGAGNLQNTGLILLSGGSVTGVAGVTNSLGGEIRGGSSLSTPVNNAGGLIRATGSGTLIVGSLTGNSAGGELRIDDGAGLRVLNSFASSGTIVLAGADAIFNGGVVTNTGTLRGLGRVNNIITNSGVLRAENGTLTFAAAGHTNAAAGRIEAATGSQVIFSQGLATNSGQVSLLGGAFDNNNRPLANLGRIEGFGTLRTGGLTNAGTISIGGGTLDILGSVTNNASVGTQSNSTIRFFGPVNGPGNYSGDGTIEFLSSFSPGESPAEVLMTNFILGGSATLVIELGGTTSGSQYDKITASGAATLAGTLDVDLIDGFTPAPGDVFSFITAAGGIAGAFASASLPTLSGANWQLLYNPNGVMLRVAITGDYNANGTVDAADYTVWRNSLRRSGVALAADGDGDGEITQLDFDVWKLHYGESFGSGAGIRRSSIANVPEPASLVLCCVALFCVIVGTRSRNL